MLGHQHQDLNQRGWTLVLIHMSRDVKDFDQLLARIAPNLTQTPSITDPDTKLYRAAGLERGKLWQVLGPRIWWRGFLAVFFKGNRPGRPEGDVMQLAGALLVRDDRIVHRWQPAHSAEQADFIGMIDSLPRP